MNNNYLKMAKDYAKKAGYPDYNSLKFAEDDKHKLELNGVKFGAVGYGDFIKYSFEDKQKAEKKRSAYLARATKIKGDWQKDKYSKNSLAINILWAGKK
jgi:hypothetical protein